MLQCVTTAEDVRNAPAKALRQAASWAQEAKAQRASSLRPKRPSTLNTRGNTTHEVRPTDVLLPLRLHPHIVLIARPRKQVFSSNAF